MAASFLLHLAAMLFAVNGMLSLRSALPTLLPAALLLQQRVPRRPLIVGSMIGFGLFVSTEQGLAAVLALSLVSVLAILTRGERRGRSIELTITLGIAIVVFVLALVAVGGFGGMRGALRYNFRLVPMDQYWYFGAPPNVFIPSWSAGFRMLVRTPPIGFPIALCICAVAWYCWSLARTRDERWARRQFALAFLSVYGLISCASLLGVFTPVYAQPCWRVVLIIAVLEVSRAAAHFDVKSGTRPLLGISRLEVAGTLGLAGYAFLSIDLLPTTIALSLPHIVRDHAFGNERFSMGGIWPEALRDGQAVVNTHRATDGKPPVIWSTYAGWLEARNGVFNPYTDYIIHALGPEGRQAYVDSLRATRPQIVQTVRPSYTFYEAWLENMTWAFYDEVLEWYAVESMSPWSLFWKRSATKADTLQLMGTMNVPAGVDTVRFPQIFAGRDSTPALVEVEIEYETHNPLGRLPIIGATPRFLVGIQGAMSRLPVSVDPFVQRERFPVVVAPGQSPLLRFATFSLLPGASWSARSIRLYRRPIDAGTAAWFADLLSTLPPPR
jgi:hypothetical protein